MELHNGKQKRLLHIIVQRSFIHSLGLSTEDLRFESPEKGFSSKVSRSWKQILPGNTVELV